MQGITPEEARQITMHLWKQGSKKQAQVISFQMLKGGVAKTTSALNVALRWAQMGFKVLLVDLDQQGNLSFAAGWSDPQLPVWADLLEKNLPPQSLIRPVCTHLDLIPSHLNNSVLEKLLIRSHRNWVKSIVDPLMVLRSSYDLIVIDTAPNISMVNTAVTLVSHLIVLPVAAEPFAVLGLKMHLREIKEITAEFSVYPEPLVRILISKFDQRESMSHDLLEQLEKRYESMLLDTVIRKSAVMNKTVANHESLFAKKSSLRDDFEALASELIQTLWKGREYAESKKPSDIQI